MKYVYIWLFHWQVFILIKTVELVVSLLDLYGKSDKWRLFRLGGEKEEGFQLG